MLVGQVAALREKRPEDVAVLHGLVAADPAFHALVDTKPWRPVEIDAARARFDEVVRERSTPDSAVQFAVQSATDNAGRCQGWATVWDLDLHNRTAHLGLGLVPGARGKGMGVDLRPPVGEGPGLGREGLEIVTEFLALPGDSLL